MKKDRKSTLILIKIMKKLDGFSKVLNFLNCYYSKKLTHKHEAPTKVSSEKVKAALQIQNAPKEQKPSLSGIGNTSQTKVLTASLEKPVTPTKKSPVAPDKKFQQHEPEKKMSAPRFVYTYILSAVCLHFCQLFVYISVNCLFT